MKTREHLIEDLNAYALRFKGENETCCRFIDFVSQQERCFDRSCREGHVTGSAWVVNRAKSHVLLTHHRKLNKWLQLGGHADGESDILRVAMREVEEESGLENFRVLSEDIFDMDIHLIPESGNEAEHYHYDLRYLIITEGSGEVVLSEESHELRWVEIEKLEELSKEESLLRMARKWKSDLCWGGFGGHFSGEDRGEGEFC